MEEPSPTPPLSENEEALNTKGFVGSLFDFSFESFVTPKLVQFLYALTLVYVVYFAISFVLDGGWSGFLWRIFVSPIVLIVGAILARVFVEIIMVLFRILELLRRFDAERRKAVTKV